jgi:hypothetical protein
LLKSILLDVDRGLLAGEEPVHGGGHGLHVYLPDRGGEEVDDALVGHGHHALTVDLDDAMADAHAAPLSYTAAQQAADLDTKQKYALQNVQKIMLRICQSESRIRTFWAGSGRLGPVPVPRLNCDLITTFLV